MARQANRAGSRSISSQQVEVSDSFTRPADTTAYTAGDAISNATGTTHTYLTFSDCAAAVGGGGTVISGVLASSANQGTKLDAELWLFHTAPTAMEDNAAFDPTDAEMLTVVGIIEFGTSDWYVGNAGAGATGNAVALGSTGVFPFVCQSTSKDLYGLLVARNAYTPVSGEVLTVTLQVQQ